MPMGTYNATDMVELKRERLFEVSTHYVRYTRKNTVFDYFFHDLTKRITSESDTASKMGPTCCPTIRSTGINPQLVVPVRYRALTVLQFWVFSAFYAFLKSKRQRAFLDFCERYAHQSFDTNVNFWGWLRKCNHLLARVQESMTRPQLRDSPVLWKIDQIQCVFPLFSALNGSFYTRFSPKCVIFTIKTENESARAPRSRKHLVPQGY